jgi:hypothetical protein
MVTVEEGLVSVVLGKIYLIRVPYDTVYAIGAEEKLGIESALVTVRVMKSV